MTKSIKATEATKVDVSLKYIKVDYIKLGAFLITMMLVGKLIWIF